MNRRPGARSNRGRVTTEIFPGTPALPTGTLNASAQNSTTSITGAVIVAGVLAASAQSSTTSITGTVVSSDPQTIMGANCTARWKSTNGITIITGVSNWADLIGGVNLANATGANQPTFSATGGPNDKPYMTYDGSNDSLAATFARSAPGTTPSVIWAVVRQITYTTNDPIFNDVAAHGVVRQVGTSPAIVIFNGGGANQCSNTAGTLNTWVRIKAEFVNSTSDSLRIISTNGAAASASSGNNAGTGPLVGRNNAATAFANFDLVELCFFNAVPSAGQNTDLDAYCTAEYGSGLV